MKIYGVLVALDLSRKDWLLERPCRYPAESVEKELVHRQLEV